MQSIHQHITTISPLPLGKESWNLGTANEVGYANDRAAKDSPLSHDKLSFCFDNKPLRYKYI